MNLRTADFSGRILFSGVTPLGNARSEGTVRFEGFELDVRTAELRSATGKTVRLSEQTLRILVALVERPGELVLREDLRKRLWPNDTVVEFEHSISAAINRLRQVLGDSAESPRFIETLARRGYRWKVAVEWQQPQIAPVSTHAPSIDGNLVGKRVSHYRVLEILGGGGMGVVYKAEDLKLGRRVALKFLPEELTQNVEAKNRFEREARAASALNHPNICTIHGVEEHAGQLFIVMELLEGQSVRDLVAAAGSSGNADGDGSLPLEHLLDIAIQTAEGLGEAHQSGIVHRDIKPANIFVTRHGHAKILDFGLAKLQEEDVHEVRSPNVEPGSPRTSDVSLTRTGVAMGTAGYMSPEQIRGEKLDARSDLFSLGLVLYEMAVGQRAFSGETAEILHAAILQDPPKPLRELNPKVPARLEEIIGKALEKDRERRYQTASELRKDLRRLKGDTDWVKSAAEPQAQHRVLTGRTLGRYEVISRLGVGEMGVVYRARDTRLNRDVALRVLPNGSVSDQERKRHFVQEARAASALNHPNIVGIHDIDQIDGVDFIAMECVSGKTLAEVIGRKGLPPAQAVAYAIQIAGALAEAHAAGIVHRNLKPRNLMLTDDGQVKVLDFGLAKLSERREPAVSTQTDWIGGTPAYMSPEQAEGKPLDARTDIFSLGSVVYEMLSGKRPFRGDSQMSTLAAIIRDDPERLSAGVPAELRKIIARCLAKDREQRYQHTGDVKLALEELRVAASVRRRRAYVAAAIVLAALPGVWLLRTLFSKPVAAPQVMSFLNDMGTVHGLNFSPDGSEVVFSWKGEPEKDNFAIYAKLIGSAAPVRLTMDPAADDTDPAFSPDGRSIGFMRTTPKDTSHTYFMLIPAIGGPPRTVAELPDSGQFDWFPGGRWIVFNDKGVLRLLSIETAEIRELTPSQVAGYAVIGPPAVSPDGHTIAFCQFRGVGEIFLQSLGPDLRANGPPRQLTHSPDEGNYSPQWTADGRYVIHRSNLGNDGLAKVAVSGDARPEHLPFGEGIQFTSFAVSRKGDRLIYSRFVGDTNIWRLPLSGPGTAAGPPARFISSTREDLDPRYSLDGKRIVFESLRGGKKAIWMSDSNGSDILEVPLRVSGQKDFGSPCLSPNGQRIVLHVRRDLMISSSRGGEPQPLSVDVDISHDTPEWSHDGKWIYFYGHRAGDRDNIWRMPAGGGPAVQLTRNGAHVPRQSADGRFIYYTEPERWRFPPLRKIPASGGDETVVLPSVCYRSYAAVKEGIYFIPGPEDGKYSIRFLSFATGKINTVSSIEWRPASGFDVSPDGRFVLYTQVEHPNTELMLVENFR
jgi:serine/threonine protein kinase/Tol biopolymer transport system component